ncbi:cytochrome c oxidase-assembly factor cox16, mitochondrial precursor [Paecilomyces variotii No. 5]|uniref:Cytochrome c oxidase assembly protein COX16, mitochondrial n=1 Tax=Byssochlamys spectabilis (strain No. 5 / NBRC 109023) TaxID=1356009 RepID=V5HY52_BYSSN|nr:cytochrome c oxidase-assembly factor cox16, mitochondrial precursor [Paecilomyces variotii No. 5]
MPTFQSKTFRRTTTASSSLGERLGALYRAKLPKHPFVLFGLPFISVMVAASFALTPATALRYERYDRKVQQLSQDEAMELGLKGPDGEGEGIKRNPRRRVVGSEREEYYRLMAKDLDNWEQKRVQRFKGEPDGRL